jgi:hypothetical protein
MKKTFLSILFFTITLSGFSQKNSSLLKDTIIWSSDYELSKEDFKGKVKKGYAGMASTYIYLYTQENNGEIQFVVEALMSRAKSALSTDSEYMLRHEKGHFDICEIYARKLRQRILKKDFMKVKNINAVISDMYRQIVEELRDAQEKYDKQTEHSMNMVQQKDWDEKIIIQLRELDDYASTIVDVVNK